MQIWKNKLGNFLFRYRSFTLLPFIILVFFIFKPSHGPFWGLFLPIFGFLWSSFGHLIRFSTVGYAAPGTSGRENFLKADTLNTTGLYSLVRNPLYIGNLFIFSGLLVAFGSIPAFLLVMLFAGVQYWLIVASEENYLRDHYGALFVNYCQVVNRWIPRSFSSTRPNRKFSWRKIMHKENDSLFNWAIIFIIILIYRERSFLGSIRHGLAYGLAASVLILIYLAVKIVKKKSPPISE